MLGVNLVDKKYFSQMFGKLMKILYGPFSSQTIADFELWIEQNGYNGFLVVKSIMHAMPYEFIFDNEEFVHMFPATAQRYGQDEFEQAKKELLPRTDGTFSMISEKLSEARIAIARANELLDRIGVFVPASSLYADFIKQAEYVIARWQEDSDDDD